ncbi:MAG: Rrf2 family transcriptional regulator [Candidatus Margulisiibacteriota bacterium]|jgi:Rrf2 family protein
MKITYKSDYALKVILELAIAYPSNLLHIEDIARRQDIPKKFLEQILLELKKQGFVLSKKGPNGGYMLAKKPQKISVGDIVRAMEGTIFPISCIDPALPATCRETSRCVFLPIWQDVNKAITDIVDRMDFQQISERHMQSQSGTNYNI